jgi:hypothetical protein
VTGEGYEPFTREVIVRRGAELPLVVSLTPQPKPPGPPQAEQRPARAHGLLVEYFQGRHFEHKAAVEVEPQIDFATGALTPHADVPRGPFSIQWRGWLNVPEAGRYKLSLEVDDGARLWLDGRLRIDRWVDGKGVGRTTVELKAGLHPLRIDYYEMGTGSSVLRLKWAREGGFGEQLVPPEALCHDPELAKRSRARLAEAEARFLATEPADAPGYLRRAEAYYLKKRYDPALADYLRWASLTARDLTVPPASPERTAEANQLNDIAWRLATSPEAPPRFARAAVLLADRACQLTQGKDPGFLNTLAAAHAANGNFALAVRWQQEAIRLTGEKCPEDYRDRLELYKQGKPYRGG